MRQARMLFRHRLKPGAVDGYLRHHRNVWPELLEAYRRAGITRISCFLQGLDLLVYSEYDVETYAREKDALSRHPAEVKWKELMTPLLDEDFRVEYPEVFHMPAADGE